ncbi:MAG: S8 family serine peptidase [Bacillota bacterium]
MTRLLWCLLIPLCLAVHGNGPAQGSVPAAGATVAAVPESLAPVTASVSMSLSVDAIAAAGLLGEAITGEGVIIAIVDTGVDPALPDLALTSDWQTKVIDWADFSGEGRVDTTLAATAFRGAIKTPYGTFIVGTKIRSTSGRYRYGLLREEYLAPGPLNQDMNGNGLSGDEFPVLLVDSLVAGVYDTVYVDINRNHDFTDDRSMGVYRRTFNVNWFGKPGAPSSVAYVVADIGEGGHYVDIGFDGNGHGTHVAGIAAASGGFRGSINGIAPGARIMAIKALDSAGNGSWQDIARAMRYAARQGAHIISLSVAALSDVSAAGSEESRLINELTETYGCLVVLAAGNNGPGVATVATPGSPVVALTVGGYMSPEMWLKYQGHTAVAASLWPSSAVGPRADGAGTPAVLAPAAAVSVVPRWLSADGTAYYEGTSMAVPFAAGAAALLLDAAHRKGLPVTPGTLNRALRAGAVPLPGYTSLEQGHGLINVTNAWAALQAGVAAVGLNATLPEAWTLGRAGIYARGQQPGYAEYQVEVRRGGVYTVTSTVPWLKPAVTHLTLQPGVPRRLGVAFTGLTEPGLHVGQITLDSPDWPGVEAELSATVIVPHKLDRPVSVSGQLLPGTYQRHFFRVLPGAEELIAQLAVGKNAGGDPTGRVRMRLYRPDGQELLRSDYTGLSSGVTVSRQLVSVPAPGVWEVLVEVPAEAADLGAERSAYVLDVGVAGLRFDMVEWTPVFEGGEAKAQLRITNGATGRILRVVASGLGAADQHDLPELAYLAPGLHFSRTLPEVPAGTSRLRVAVANPSSPGVDLDLYLYRYDPLTRDLEPAGTSANAGLSQEAIELDSPQPGQYVVYVEAAGLWTDTTFEYSFAAYADKGHLQLTEAARQLRPGETWVLSLKAKQPAGAGPRFGKLLFIDTETDLVVATLPVAADAAGVPLMVNLWEAGLGPAPGGQRLLTLTVRDPVRLSLVDAVLEVNGVHYQATGGRLTLRAGPALEVWARHPDYASAYRRFLLPADLGGPPVPGLETPERETILRRLVHQLSEWDLMKR